MPFRPITMPQDRGKRTGVDLNHRPPPFRT